MFVEVHYNRDKTWWKVWWISGGVVERPGRGDWHGKLTANEVKAFFSKPGTYQDGDGLFLKVDMRGRCILARPHPASRKAARYTIGTAKLVTLANARIKAAKLREAVRIKGRDPVAEKRKTKATERHLRRRPLMPILSA